MFRVFGGILGMAFISLSSIFFIQVAQAEYFLYGLSMLGYAMGSIGLGGYLVYISIFRGT